jgi:hypothetical protein
MTTQSTKIPEYTFSEYLFDAFGDAQFKKNSYDGYSLAYLQQSVHSIE